MLWAFVFGFCLVIAFLASYIELEKDKAYKKMCPTDIIDEKTDELLKEGVNPYDCIPSHMIFLDTVRYTLIAVIPVYALAMLVSFHKILRMI